MIYIFNNRREFTLQTFINRLLSKNARLTFIYKAFVAQQILIQIINALHCMTYFVRKKLTQSSCDNYNQTNFNNHVSGRKITDAVKLIGCTGMMLIVSGKQIKCRLHFKCTGQIGSSRSTQPNNSIYLFKFGVD